MQKNWEKKVKTTFFTMINFVIKSNLTKNMMTFLKGVSSYAGLTHYWFVNFLEVHLEIRKRIMA